MQEVSAIWGPVLTGGAERPPSRITLQGGRIETITTESAPCPGDLVVEEGWIAPGLIDLQVNGAGGVDLTSLAGLAVESPPALRISGRAGRAQGVGPRSRDPAALDPCGDPDAGAGGRALERVARVLVRHGVTAFCPTLVSAPAEMILARLPDLAPRRIAAGAASLGAHLEGPFLSPAHAGVHDARVLRPPTDAEVGTWLAAGPPTLVTLAPELPGGLAAIERLVQAGVRVSLGHSGADARQAQAALAAGATLGTHLFNAMPPLHHRAPGLVGALLASDATLCLIADGFHLDPLLIDLVVRRAGPGRVALVSDALSAAGTAAGGATLAGQDLVRDGSVLRRADGTLAGSLQLLDVALRNVHRWLPDLGPAALVEMVTGAPARAIGAHDRGRLASGCVADLLVFDRDLDLQQVILGGSRVA
jgi:N-acetylglucosamine-6-phosphate deacetylase